MRILKAALTLVLIALVAIAVFLQTWPDFGGAPSEISKARIASSSHFEGGEFKNAYPLSPRDSGMLQEQLARQFWGEEERHPTKPLPIEPITARDFAEIRDDIARVAWLGHSSVYAELSGIRIMFDPVFSQVASPVNFIGPERFHPVPFEAEILPKIDIVAISHDHYDHLDMDAAVALAANGIHFVVPLGIAGHLERWGVPTEQISELEWSQTYRRGKVAFTSTESRHYSGRSITDANQTLWSSWVVQNGDVKLYFSGDTGYSDHFANIGAEHGPFNLTLMKVGAYGPGARWRDVHMSAEDAVRAHQDLGGEVMLPVHWSTFNLGFHDWYEPIEKALAQAETSKARVITPEIGRLVTIGSDNRYSQWWKSPPE